MKKKLVPVVILTFILVICCIVFIAPSKSGDNPNDSALLQKIIIIVTLLIIVLVLLRKVFSIPLSKKWIGGIAGGIAIVVIAILILTHWDELGFRKGPAPPAPGSSVYHEASLSQEPDIHHLEFGENHMRPGEVWCFTGDAHVRHFASKEDGSPIIAMKEENKLQSNDPSAFEEKIRLHTENGEEKDLDLFYQNGVIHCGYTIYLKIDSEATIIVTDPDQ